MKGSKVKRDCLKIVLKYFGEYSRGLYEEFYTKIDEEQAVASLNFLLVEMMGAQKAKKIIARLLKRYPRIKFEYDYDKEQ